MTLKFGTFVSTIDFSLKFSGRMARHKIELMTYSLYSRMIKKDLFGNSHVLHELIAYFHELTEGFDKLI